MNFADTNWLAVVYFASLPGKPKHASNRKTVERFMRLHGGKLVLSHIVLLEARNIFSRLTNESEPEEWTELQSDFNGKLYVDPMNWHLLRRETESLFTRYSCKESIGSLDALIVASAKLAGATRFLSFDSLAAALASAEGIEAFPPLNSEGKRFLRNLTRSTGRR